MKKLIPVLLLLVLLLQSGGLWVLLQLKNVGIQQKIMRRLDDEKEHFELLTLSKKEFESCRVKPHEIRYHGKMYDFKSVREVGDTVFLKAIHDHEEESNLQHIKALLHPKKEQPDYSLRANQLHFLVYICHDIGVFRAFFADICFSPMPSFITNMLFCQPLDIDVPPPRVVVLYASIYATYLVNT